MVSIVTVHLLDLGFFFISILGEVVIIHEEAPVVVALEVEPPPLEALTNFPP